MKHTVVLTGAFPAIARELLSQDCDVIEHPTEHDRSEDDLVTILSEADAAIVMLSDRVTRAVLEANPNLRMVANYGAGTDNIDLAAARELGVVITNTPEPDTARAAATDVIRFLRGLPPVNRVA